MDVSKVVDFHSFVLFRSSALCSIDNSLSRSHVVFDQHLVSGYGHDPVITLLLNHTRIHFLPSMNPDGFEKSSEGSCAHGKGRFVMDKL